MPAEHLEHKSDFESFGIYLIKGQNFLEEECVGRQEGMKGSAVEKREGVGGFVEIHLAADIVHAQVELLSADLGRLLVVIQTSLLMHTNAF